MAPSLDRQKRIIRRAALSQGIRPAVLWGLYGAETDFGRNVQSSSAGAQGPFQFMPDTARSLGINPHNFRQAAFGAAKYLAQFKGRGTRGMLAAYNAGPAGNPNNPETAAYVPKVLQLAGTWSGASGGGGGRRGGGGPRRPSGAATAPSQPDLSVQSNPIADALLSKLAAPRSSPPSMGLQAPAFAAGPRTTGSPVVAQSGGPAPKDGVASLLAAAAQAAGTSSQAAAPSKAMPKAVRRGGGRDVARLGGAPPPRELRRLSGTTRFEGKPVAAWIAPVLRYARRNGWKGQVSSGVRSYGEQKAIYDSGVRPAAVPGTSNHEGTRFPRGAVDVSDATQLAAILSRSRYRRLLQWAGAKDPVHFSRPHNGSY